VLPIHHHIYVYIGRVDIRVAAYMVIVDEGRILLAHWNEYGRSGWTLPGGGLEPGENPADAARREVTEETGYAADLDKLLGIDSVVIPAKHRVKAPGRPLHALRIIYKGHITSGTLANEVDGSTDSAAWFRFDELAKIRRVQLVETGLRLANISIPGRTRIN
jgi:8-oxo-dGTP diphosphatase